MSKVGIIGAAGTLGSCAAFAIASRGIADEVRLFDLNHNLAQAHAMDLRTAVAGRNQSRVELGREEDLGDCDVVVMAAGAPWRQIASRMELLWDSLPIVRTIAGQVARRCPDAVVILATNPVDPLNVAFQGVSGMDRRRVVGYTINDSYRFRMLAAQALGVAGRRVEGFVLGEHGEHQVPLFSSLRVDGEPVAVTPALRERILGEIPKILRAYESLGTGRTSGWTSALGLADMVEAVLGDTGRLFPCSVKLEGEYGRRGFSVGVPARLGRSGVLEVLEWTLPADERAALEGAFDFLEAVAQRVREHLKSTGPG